MRRRDLLRGALPLATLAMPRLAWGRPTGDLWRFDSLRSIGGLPVEVLGAPTLIDSPWGAATAFDGVDDALLIGRHPLVGARTFTAEALFRPDGGAFEQRWFHLEADDGAGGAPGTGTTRMLFEIRVVDRSWYLDAFVTGPGYKQTLIAPARRFPVGRWYHVAQSYDGHVYRAFVDGVVQAEAPIAFAPQRSPGGPGRAAIGMRMNRVNYFHGAVRAAFFARRALDPADFRLLPPGTARSGRGRL
ncbi:LamG-like jellyroll fold domain-containing protein [Sphingomonas sp. NFR15]|uniref:LamG-like jellyroll fold domain-containing protein n=1 Tax=Sphingomonas sp. NFR15 TaxID=1566282 RepID=UPI00089114C3|nr:LamG-like jellyroll fold domain-containing protein [Sphingomonas sp. NFR15]SDA15569.1 Concanavalin A-like lectin/glucanases superfamily protein [Sphingomonas sp. NFR15]